MTQIPPGLRTTTRVVTLMVFLLVPAARANAATIIFDFCTTPSLCNEVSFLPQRQPGGQITSSLGGSGIDILAFGINFAPDVNVSFFWPPSNPTATLGPGTIGPYGEFAQRWAGPPVENFQNILIEFRDPDGPFPDALAPFFENSDGFFIAAQIQDSQTGETGFVAARLNDITPVPEPGTMLLCASGLALIARRARRRRAAERDLS